MARGETMVWASGESLASLLELSELLEMGALALDGDLVVVGWNAWLAATSGRDAAAAVGQPLFSIFPEMEGGPAEAAIRRGLTGATTVWSQQFHGHLLPLPPPSGYEGLGHMQQSARIVPLLRSGQIEGVLALVQDVTERVVREQELRVALDRVEVASQAKSDFLASMSHELRTPLAAIIGYMDLLRDEMVGPVSTLQKNYLGRVKTAARHLTNIIEEILTFSRIEAGKEQIVAEEIDAAELARGIAMMFELQAQQKQIELTAALTDAPVPMRTDPTKLRQILINLLGNAMKFTDQGGVCLTLTTASDHVRFSITDTGPGIAATDVERIFDPFTQLDQSLKRAKGGTGLGLPVSRKLAHLLGGDLTLESTRGKGAAFTLLLPLDVGTRAGAEREI